MLAMIALQCRGFESLKPTEVEEGKDKCVEMVIFEPVIRGVKIKGMTSLALEFSDFNFLNLL